jgi:hypothetical protein
MPRSRALSRLCAGLALAGLLFAGPVAPTFAQDTQCARPRAPEVPDGEKATDVQMIGTNQRMKLYQVAVQAFLECNAKARAEIGTVARDMKLRRVDKARDEVTAELKATADKYNKQVRAYRAKKGIPNPEDEATAEGDAPAEGSAGAAREPDTAPDKPVDSAPPAPKPQAPPKP